MDAKEHVDQLRSKGAKERKDKELRTNGSAKELGRTRRSTWLGRAGRGPSRWIRACGASRDCGACGA